MKYLGCPFDLKLNIDENRHTIDIYNKWNKIDFKIPLEGSVKGVVGDNYDTVKKKLLQGVRGYIKGISDVQMGKIRETDFIFTYIINEVDSNGRVWTGRGVSFTMDIEKN